MIRSVPGTENKVMKLLSHLGDEEKATLEKAMLRVVTQVITKRDLSIVLLLEDLLMLIQYSIPHILA